jgi:hypothetical protein
MGSPSRRRLLAALLNRPASSFALLFSAFCFVTGGVHVQVPPGLPGAPRPVSVALVAAKKVVILHDAHEGSHATCEAFAHLCVRTDCREVHDALFHNNTIDWPAITASDAEVFLTRFFPPHQSLEPWLNTSVLLLVRRDVLAWSLGSFHISFPHEPKALPGQLVNINASLVEVMIKRKIDSWRHKVEALERLVTEGDVDTHVYFYESFLQDGLDYLRRVATAAGLGADFAAGSCVDQFSKDLTRTHGDQPCATRYGTASNCDEITALMTRRNYPTWDGLAGARFGELAVL